jgi:sulfide dehydrogenase [flavocytochrome c] flavoprotein chain
MSTNKNFSRRDFLLSSAGASLLAMAPGLAAAQTHGARKARVVVLGAGFGGATAAKYIKRWAPEIDVTVIERNEFFVSCPQSNLILSGGRTLEQLTTRYDTLTKAYGVNLIRDEAIGIDHSNRQVRLRRGNPVPYDRLILSPGIDLDYSALPGIADEAKRQNILHAWKAGPQTVALRKQLEAIPDGGVYVLTIPKAPYRCPPGPYERISLVASYFKEAKPKSKIIVLDPNPEIVSKKGLFTAAWNELYPGIIDYRPNNALRDVDPLTLTAKTDFETVKADVLNVVPQNLAGAIAFRAGVIDADGRWSKVDFATYESQSVPGIHVIGDATVSSPAPKSGHVANQQGKIVAGAVVSLLRGQQPYGTPVFSNTCYSYVSNAEAIHVAAVYRYDPAKQTIVVAEGTGVSEKRNAAEADFARAWATNIWADALL